jgi:hypothetical protein
MMQVSYYGYVANVCFLAFVILAFPDGILQWLRSGGGQSFDAAFGVKVMTDSIRSVDMYTIDA